MILKRLSSIVMIFCVTTAFCSARHGVPSDSMVTRLIQEGDDLVKERFENELGLKKYLEALRRDSTNSEILWRISRAYIDIGEHVPIQTKEQQEKQLETYETALAFAERSVQADSQNAMAWTRQAIAKGRIALFRGIWESLSLVKETKADVETALALDPDNDVANYILGRVHAKVTEKPRILRWPLGLGWADLDDAVKYYERAISLKPDFIMYRLDCARAYVEEEEFEKAKEHLRLIETFKNSDEDDDRFREEARALMKEIEKEE